MTEMMKSKNLFGAFKEPLSLLRFNENTVLKE